MWFKGQFGLNSTFWVENSLHMVSIGPNTHLEKLTKEKIALHIYHGTNQNYNDFTLFLLLTLTLMKNLRDWDVVLNLKFYVLLNLGYISSSGKLKKDNQKKFIFDPNVTLIWNYPCNLKNMIESNQYHIISESCQNK